MCFRKSEPSIRETDSPDPHYRMHFPAARVSVFILKVDVAFYQFSPFLTSGILEIWWVGSEYGQIFMQPAVSF